MSQSKNRHEAERWLETAEEDMRAAQTLQAAELYAHACFMAQQCGEKSVKAMWYVAGQDPWGHSIQKLVMQFPEQLYLKDIETWKQQSAALDRFYVPTRYPNGLPDLTPEQSYFARDAEQAIQQAAFFLQAAALSHRRGTVYRVAWMRSNKSRSKKTSRLILLIESVSET